MQGSGACWPGPQGLGAEMLERRQEHAFHGTVNGTVAHGESGGIQAPGACGPGFQGAWGPGPQGLGPGPNHPLKLRFFANLLLAETAASDVGTWRETKPGYPPLPPPSPPPRFGEKGKGFHPLRLRQPSNTPPQGRRIHNSTATPVLDGKPP